MIINIMIAISSISLVIWILWACHENKKMNQDENENIAHAKFVASKITANLYHGHE